MGTPSGDDQSRHRTNSSSFDVHMTKSLDGLRRNRSFIALLGLLIAVVGILASVRWTQDLQSDFASDYATTKTVGAGGNPYENAPRQMERWIPGLRVPYEGDRDFPNWRPPFRFLTTWPFTKLSYTSAANLWAVILAICTVGGIVMVARAAGWTWTTAAVVAAGALSLPAVRDDMRFGQINGVLLILLATTWLALKRERPWSAGIALGTTIAMKVFPVLLLIPLVARRNYKAAGAALGSAAVLTFAGLWFIGFDRTDDFVSVLRGGYGSQRTSWANVSIAAHLGWFGLVAAVAVAAVLWRHRARASGDWFWSAIPLVILAWPIVWNHYFVLAIPWVMLAFKMTPVRVAVCVAVLLALVPGWLSTLALLGAIALDTFARSGLDDVPPRTRDPLATSTAHRVAI